MGASGMCFDSNAIIFSKEDGPARNHLWKFRYQNIKTINTVVKLAAYQKLEIRF